MNARLRKACLSAFLGLASATALAQAGPLARLAEPASFLQGISAVQVDDVALRLPLPAGWAYEAEGGLFMASTQADIAALRDDDPATRPQDGVIAFANLDAAALGLRVADGVDPLMVAFVAQTESAQGRLIEASVAGRRALATAFTRQDGLFAWLVSWGQGERLLQFALISPQAPQDDEDAAALQGLFAQLIARISPAVPFVMDQVAYAPDLGLALSHPQDWVAQRADQVLGVFQNQADIAPTFRGAQGTVSGAVLLAFRRSPSTLGELSSRDSLYAALQGQQSQAIERLGDVRARESNGVAARYTLADGRRVLAALTVNLARDEALFYFLSYPPQASEADEAAMQALFFAVLHAAQTLRLAD
jgi:hypothetical protein